MSDHDRDSNEQILSNPVTLTHGPTQEVTAMINARTVVMLSAFALIFPPVGIPALILYIVSKVAKHEARDGGRIIRRHYDAWAAEEPWWTGNEEADQQELARRMAAVGPNPDRVWRQDRFIATAHLHHPVGCRCACHLTGGSKPGHVCEVTR